MSSFDKSRASFHCLMPEKKINTKNFLPRSVKKNHLMEASFEYASLGIIVIDQNGVMQLVNPFALQLFGYKENELIGQTIEQLIPERFQKGHVGHREQFMRQVENRTFRCDNVLSAVKKDGTEFPVEVSLGYYHNDGDQCVIAFVRDISNRKQKEEEIKKLNEVLEKKVEERTYDLSDNLKKLEISRKELKQSLDKEKNLNELKSRFVTMASHEFRTPLSTVLSSAYLLEKYTTAEDQPKRKKHIERIISSVNMLTDILNDFLSVGKIEEGKIILRPVSLNIRDDIRSIIGEMKSLQKKGQHIFYHHSGKEIAVIDPAIFKHIVMNLLSNAMKFSPENNPIEIRTKLNNKQFILSIRDQGIGISVEDQEHLFERFHRGSNVTNIQGTGLGLHIVAKYAELLNGKIKCNSELEKGTEFTLRFELPDEKN